jgi:hypothetical protein
MLPIAPASAFDREKTATRAGIVSDSRNESNTSKAQAVPASANVRQHADDSSWYQGSPLAVKAGLCGNGVLLIVPPLRATSPGVRRRTAFQQSPVAATSNATGKIAHDGHVPDAR